MPTTCWDWDGGRELSGYPVNADETWLT
jgi:hypothetical protein